MAEISKIEKLCNDKNIKLTQIDVSNSKVIEFFDQELEDLKTKIAKKLGYELIDHKLELYAIPLKKTKK